MVDLSEYADKSCDELDDAVSRIQSALKEFRLEHVKLSALLGDQYGDTRLEFQKGVISEAKKYDPKPQKFNQGEMGRPD